MNVYWPGRRFHKRSIIDSKRISSSTDCLQELTGYGIWSNSSIKNFVPCPHTTYRQSLQTPSTILKIFQKSIPIRFRRYTLHCILQFFQVPRSIFRRTHRGSPLLSLIPLSSLSFQTYQQPVAITTTGSLSAPAIIHLSVTSFQNLRQVNSIVVKVIKSHSYYLSCSTC